MTPFFLLQTPCFLPLPSLVLISFPPPSLPLSLSLFLSPSLPISLAFLSHLSLPPSLPPLPSCLTKLMRNFVEEDGQHCTNSQCKALCNGCPKSQPISKVVQCIANNYQPGNWLDPVTREVTHVWVNNFHAILVSGVL